MLGLILLFIILTPGVLVTIPKGKNKILTACVHAALFVFLMQWLRVEGFQDAPPAPPPPPAANAANQIDTYFMLKPNGASNFYTTDARIKVTGGGTGKVNIVSSDPAVKIGGIMIHGLKASSPTWPEDNALMTATGYNGTKLVLSKGNASSTGPQGFMFGSGGMPVMNQQLNIKGMWGTAVWGAQNPNQGGTAPPSGATGGNGKVNTRIRFMLA